MTDRPIIFSAPMVRALFDFRKRQTRRKLRVPPPLDPSDDIDAPVCAGFIEPQYRRGDRLYVREAHYLTDDGESEYAVFAADQDTVDEHLANMQTTMASHPSIDWSKHSRFRPSIHMPRWASRLTLIVTDVRVQRLQDISEADAVAEGLQYRFLPPDKTSCGVEQYRASSNLSWTQYPEEAFADLWNSLHGPDAWDANPWVVAVSFDTHRRNIDQMEDA